MDRVAALEPWSATAFLVWGGRRRLALGYHLRTEAMGTDHPDPSTDSPA